MKKIISICTAILVSTIAFAQQGKEFYNRYAGKNGVDAVYISPEMFALIKSIPDINVEGKDVDLGKVIKTLDGMYILDIENEKIAGELSADISRMTSEKRFELLMETVEGDGTSMRIYIVRKQDIVTDLLMHVREKGSASVISISATMPFEDLKKLLAGAID